MSTAKRLEEEALRPQGSFYRQMFFRKQWGTPKGREHIAQAAADTSTANPRFSNMGTRYLRSLNFSFVRQGMKASGSRRANFFLFLLPITLGAGIGISNFSH